MSINDIRDIVIKQATSRGYRCEERKSSSTDSWYFKIYSIDTSLLFRVSNHTTRKNVITLRTDRKMRREDVLRFVNNRLDDLSFRRVKSLLNKNSKI